MELAICYQTDISVCLPQENLTEHCIKLSAQHHLCVHVLLILEVNSLQAISAVLRLLSLIAIVAAIDEVVRAVGIPENRKHNKVDEYG